MAEEKRELKVLFKRFSYLISILLAFLLPIVSLLRFLAAKVPRKPFIFSAVTIAFIGWGWSWVVSFNNWWTFGKEFLTGIMIVPYLPLEELLFYPLGGMVSILIYLRVQLYPVFQKKTPVLIYWLFLSVGSLVFGILVWMTKEEKPMYLLSQLIVYNIVCSLFLAPLVAKEVRLYALFVPILILGFVGFLWNYIGFKYGWWVYNATTEIKISIVPIDDFNFFLFAPTAANSIYLLFCRVFGYPPIRSQEDL